ncbi:MAG: hypothetical protein ACTS73_01630 [Arsenophonus sp. NEOnobi-MAG3]
MANIMMMKVHRQATRIPKIKVALHVSKEPASSLAKRYSISELTFSKGAKTR